LFFPVKFGIYRSKFLIGKIKSLSTYLVSPQSRRCIGWGLKSFAWCLSGDLMIVADETLQFSLSLSLSLLGSTAQLRPWPPPQNLAEFLGGFSTIFFLQGRVVSPTPNPHPGGPGLCIYIPQRQGGYPF
jgi:hypothetical protein